MKWLFVVLGITAAAIIVLMIYAKVTREPSRLSPEDEAYNRRVYAQNFQDRMRDEAYGPNFTAKTIGDDAKILELGFSTCNHDTLDVIVASPSVQHTLNEFGFYKIRCRDSGVEAHWDYRR